MSGRVMVTGAGGSIGSELVRVLCSSVKPPSLIVAVDLSEYGLYELQESVACLGVDSGVVIKYLIGDVRDNWLMDRVMRKYKPATIFHAAALKHVPMVEEPHNAIEGVRTNILGTQTVFRTAIDNDVKRFVFISTDKAVNPISMMGATKTFAEGYCREMAKYIGRTSAVVVRFGNVIGSSGSVIPKFKKQIADGGPVTVTHPDMMRYFMSIKQAVELVIHASEFSTGTYILDMGKEVNIRDLAMTLIAEADKVGEIKIDYIGIRAGEKVREELIHAGESLLPTSIDKVLRVIGMSEDIGFVGRAYCLHSACERRSLSDVIDTIREVVPYEGGISCETL